MGCLGYEPLRITNTNLDNPESVKSRSRTTYMPDQTSSGDGDGDGDGDARRRQ